jgi:hypothetical protein
MEKSEMASGRIEKEVESELDNRIRVLTAALNNVRDSIKNISDTLYCVLLPEYPEPETANVPIQDGPETSPMFNQLDELRSNVQDIQHRLDLFRNRIAL